MVVVEPLRRPQPDHNPTRPDQENTRCQNFSVILMTCDTCSSDERNMLFYAVTLNESLGFVVAYGALYVPMNACAAASAFVKA
jgi:hypothetical protein